MTALKCNAAYCLASAFLLAASAQAQVANVSLSPATGTSAYGVTQAFTAKYSADLGATDISEADLDINTSAMAVSGCSMTYSYGSNGFYLASDNRTSWLGPLTPGSSGTLQNSQCTLHGTGSSVTTSGNQLTLIVSVSFTAAFAGTKGVDLWAYDSHGDSSGVLEMGNWTVTAPPAPDLTIAESHSPFTFAQLQTNTYTITASNSGNAATNGSTATVTDSLPAGLTAASIAGTGWTCTLATLTCTRSDVLAAGSSYPGITLSVNVANNPPATVVNSVYVSGGGEINAGNDSFDDVTGVGQSTKATLTTPAPGSTLTGPVVTFAWTRGQAGNYYLYVGTTGAGSTDIFSGGGASNLSQTVTGLPVNGATVYVRLTTCLSGCYFDDYTYTAYNSGGSGVPFLTIAKHHTGNFTAGQTGAIYTITVTNNGTGPTNGSAVTVADTLPAGLTANSITGTGWSCTPPGGSCSRSDALAAGNSYPSITLSVNVANSAPSSVVNMAGVSGGGSPPGSVNDTTTILPITVNFYSSTTWTVPAGVTSITVLASGGSGGNGGSDVNDDPGGGGGSGGTAQGIVAVTPGTILNVYAGATGFNGADESSSGGGGGGYSGVFNGSTALVVAGGGGGGGGANAIPAWMAALAEHLAGARTTAYPAAVTAGQAVRAASTTSAGSRPRTRRVVVVVPQLFATRCLPPA